MGDDYVKAEAVCILFISLIGVVAIMTIEIVHAGHDNTGIDATIIGFLTPTLFAILGMMKAQQTAKKVEDLQCAIQDQTAQQTTELKQDNADVAAGVVQQVTDMKDKALQDVAIGGLTVQVAKNTQAIESNKEDS